MDPASQPRSTPLPRALERLREHHSSPLERAAFIAAMAIVMGALFVTSYTLALGDPVPHEIDAALVGNPKAHPGAVDALQKVAEDSLDFSRYGSVGAALRAIDRQQVYAALDMRSGRPALYVASAAGASG